MENHIDNQYELEPQQFERLYEEEDIPLKDLSRGMGPKLLGVAIALFIIVFAVANVVTYPDQIELPFVLRGNNREQVYTFPFPVYIKEVFVTSGESLQANQPILRLASPEIAALISDLEGRTARKTTFETYTGSSYASQLEMLDKQILQMQARIVQLQSDIDLHDQQWKSRASMLDLLLSDAKDQFETSQKLKAEGVISRLALQEKEAAYAQARDSRSNGESLYQRERLNLQAQLEETKQSMASAKIEKSKFEFEKSARSGDLDSEAAAANTLIQNIFGLHRIENGSIVLLSPGEQNVSFIFEGDGEIGAGMTVLKLNQTVKADYAFIKCPPAFAGKVREGMKTHLKVASFPYYEWGVAEGTVRSRSLSPDQNGEYNIQVSLDQMKRLEGLLFPGLDGSAVIILEEKTLFQYFFRSLSKSYHKLAGSDVIAPR